MRDIHCTPVNKSIAHAIATLAQSLSLSITAEGIEKPAEREVIRELGCDEGQGYLFSPALAADDLLAWLTVQRIRTRRQCAVHV